MQWQLLLVCATWTTQVCVVDAQADCHPLCLSCSGPELNQCLECRQYRYNNTCVQQCPPLTYTNTTTPTEVVPKDPTTSNRSRGNCVDCHPECQDGCYGNTSRDCYRCKHVNFNGTCLSCCPDGSYRDPEDSCRRCHEECERDCTGPGPTHCHRCKHVQYGDRCLHTCPGNTYQRTGTPSICRPCHTTCEDGCVGPGPQNCAPLPQNERASQLSVVLPLVITGVVVVALLGSCLVGLVSWKRRLRSRKPHSSPTRNLACYEPGSVSTIAIPLGPEESPMSDLYRNVCIDNATFANDSDDDVDVSPAPSLVLGGGRSDDNSSSISGRADTVSEGAVSNESRSTDSTVVRVPIPASERQTRDIQTNFEQAASSRWSPDQSSSQQALDKMSSGWRFSYLTDDSGIVSDGSRSSTMDNQSRWSVTTSGTVGSGDSRVCLQDTADTAVNRKLSQEAHEKDVRRTPESLQGAPADKQSTEVESKSWAAEPGAVNFSTPRFVAGMVDKRGGHLTLENLGIDLYVPPDAVEHDGTEIFMYARGAEEPAMETEGNRWTPPVIQCGSHGLKFKRHVILTVKHPAEDLTKWAFKFQASNTDVGETPDWKDLTQDQSALCFAYGDKTVIFVDHFTLYNVSGELLGAEGADGGEKTEWKRFRVGVFAEPLFLDTEIFQLRVRCWQDNDYEQQRSREKEQYLGAVQLGDDKVLHLAGDGGNLSVVLERLRPGWLAFNGDRQTIPFPSLWNEHAEMPSCTFDIERQLSGLVPKTIVCKVTALQVSYPDKSVSIDVLKQLCPRQGIQSVQTSDRPLVASLDSESTFLRLQPELRPTPRCVPQFPGEEQFSLLCLVLDVEDPAGRDWRSVAETLDLPYEFIQWMKQRGDPTRRMLDFLVAQHGGDSLRVLRDALAAIGHERAQQMVEAIMMGTSHHGPAGGAVRNSSSGRLMDNRLPGCGTTTTGDYTVTTTRNRNSLAVLQPFSHVNSTSCGSTTVEKVCGDRSLGDGQEADASMTSTPTLSPENSPHPTEESNNSITVPKTLRTQESGYHSDDRSPGENSSKVKPTDQDVEENSSPTEKNTTPWPLLMNLKNKMSIRSKSLPDLLWGQNKTDAAKQANKNISEERLSQTM
ncbi:hypothetical protein Bbelb_431280 [Branchiostoma belcheri]|nr:hypothetical protein Bbelb_431280 [Branchiostoma belcheri]